MGKKNLTFGDIEIEKDKFYHYKSPIYLYNDYRVKPLYVNAS